MGINGINGVNGINGFNGVNGDMNVAFTDSPGGLRPLPSDFVEPRPPGLGLLIGGAGMIALPPPLPPPGITMSPTPAQILLAAGVKILPPPTSDMASASNNPLFEGAPPVMGDLMA